MHKRYQRGVRKNRTLNFCSLIFRDRFYRKLEYDLPYIKRLSTLEATKELMNSDNYFVNIQLLRFILSCLNLRNNLLSIQTDVT